MMMMMEEENGLWGGGKHQLAASPVASDESLQRTHITHTIRTRHTCRNQAQVFLVMRMLPCIDEVLGQTDAGG